MFLILSAIVTVSLGAAQPSQDMPHRVFGTVEDTQDSVVTSTEVKVLFEGETLASDTTDEDGYYDMSVPHGDDFAGEEVQIQVSGSQVGSLTYSEGKVENMDFTVDNTQEQTDQNQEPSSGGGGGGGGGFQQPQTQTSNSSVNESTEIETNQTVEQTNNDTEVVQDTDDGDNNVENDDEGNRDSEAEEVNSTGSNQSLEDGSETNSVTGLFAAQPLEPVTNIIRGTIDWITSLF